MVEGDSEDSVMVAIADRAAGVHSPFISANLAKPRRDRLTIVSSPSRGIAPMFQEMERTGWPSTSHLGSIPSPGRSEAASHPWSLCGAPSAMLTVT
jgi:hypothetical protein